MKRSEVNAAVMQARELLAEYRWSLPEWANWSMDDYANHPELATHLYRHQMGWDVTDFGSGDFSRCGLSLFCLRNGVQSDTQTSPYAEKLLFIGENQETPFHYHKIKMEDIINRGGGILVVQFRHQDPGIQENIEVNVDGNLQSLAPEETLELKAGQSVTMTRGLYHRFYAKPGHGVVLGGEVSQVNDDGADNFFLDDIGRFSSITEDEPSLHPLWNEIKPE